MAKKRKFYSVAKGHKPGIYETWSDVEAQIAGFSGPKHKSFATRAEALAYLKSSIELTETTSETGDNVSKEAIEKLPADIIHIFTDGGARNNPGPGGYGCVLVYNGKLKELSGGFRMTTNNRMELMGCIVALKALKRFDIPVVLTTDSSYVVNGINKGWARKWRRNGWRKSDSKPALNSELWAELLDLVENLNITFKWVKGHSGNPFNERCDYLAVASSKLDDLPSDENYNRKI